MLPRSTDRLFLAFCRSGDPGALARVFDRTAPELLRVALYLSGNRSDAEDLLQRTFLAAIESRDKYDGKRRALPWLLGILSNHAKRLQRENTESRLAQNAELERLGEGPERSASDRELRQHIARLRGEMGSPYAEVLDLYLEQGLNAKEIAERLGRPAGTVRTQLMRGRELLRKHLPRDYVAALLPVVPGLQGLAAPAAIKAHVVLSAEQAAGVAATATPWTTTALATGGLLMSKKLSFAVPAALLLAAGIYATWPSGDEPPDHRGSARVAKVDALRSNPDRIPIGTAAMDSGPAEPTRQAVEIAADTDPGFGSVRVEVRWHDGKPAPNIGVGAEGLGTVRNEQRLAVTADDGACVLRHLRPGSWRISATHAHQPMEIEVVGGAPQLCTITANAAGTARGRVVDHEDQPVADAWIWIATNKYGRWRRFPVAKSDAAGRFTLPLAVPVHMGAQKPGLVDSLAVAVDPEGIPADIELELRGPAARVEGTVRDAQGQPIAWARVHVGGLHAIPRSLNGPYQTELFEPVSPEAMTDTDGHYVVDGVEPGRETVRAWASGYTVTMSTIEATAGVTVCDLILGVGTIVEGRVHDARNKPVPDVRVGPSWEQGRFIASSSRTDAAGNFRLIDLPTGRVSMTAKGTAGRATTVLDLHVGATTRWDPELRQNSAIRGRVLGIDGQPSAGMTICVTDGGFIGGGPNTKTNGDGVFKLQPPADRTIDLRLGELSQPALRMVYDVAPGTDDLVIQLTAADVPSAKLRGRVVDNSSRPLTATITASQSRARQGYADQTSADGRFAVGPVIAGRYRVRVATASHGNLVLPDQELRTGQERDLGEIVLQTPGHAVITVLDERGQPTRGFVALYTENNGWVASASTDQGRANFPALQPGRYFAICGGAPRAGHATFEVHAATKAITEIQLARVGHADLTVEDSTTSEELELQVRAFRGSLSDRGSFAGLFGNTRGGGRVRLWLRPGRYSLDVQTGDRRRVRVTLSIRDLDHHPTVRAILPKR